MRNISIVTFILIATQFSIAQPCGENTILNSISCSTPGNGPINQNSPDQITGTYACGIPNNNLSAAGPDHVYVFSSQVTGTVTFQLSGMNCNLNLYILSSTCNPSTGCIAGGTNTTGNETVAFSAILGMVYYIIVESPESNPPYPCSYLLKAINVGTGGCKEDCDNVIDDDLDSKIDCVDTDCGPDTDSDGLCNEIDLDDDNDGVHDIFDLARLNPQICTDSDNDGCDDCSIGTDGFGPLADNTPLNDGLDNDNDGICNTGDNCVNVANPLQSDVDNDGIGDLCDPNFSPGNNMGVGTSAPKSRLHVYNGVVFVDNTSGGIIMRSPNGNCWFMTINNAGTVSTVQVDCPN